MTSAPPQTPGPRVPAPNIAEPGRARAAVLCAAGVLALAAAMLFALRIGGGAFSISWGDLFDWILLRPIDPRHENVLRMVRLPRVLMAALAGAALACAGAVYQGLLRNPLAEPYTLGVSGGATFGAVLAIWLAGSFGAGAGASSLPILSMAALAGAGAAVLLVFAMARSMGRFEGNTIILAGVTLNLVFSSLILLLEYLSDFTQVYEMIRWMMGGLDVIGFRDFRVLAPVTLVALAVIFASARDLDLIAVDPLSAATLGVRVEAVRWRALLAASMMTGCVVAFAGPIGFVGLMVPHGARMLVGARHSRVLPASILAGALLLLACDTLAQNILAQEELPVGIVTAMLGGPFFVFLLLRRPAGKLGGG